MKNIKISESTTQSGFKKNSFISVFPTSKPKFVLALMLDEPKTNSEYIYNYRDG